MHEVKAAVPGQAKDALQDEKWLAAELGIMHRLQALSTRLIHAGELQALLQDILAFSAELTGTNKGSIQLLDPVTGSLRIVAHQGLGTRLVQYFAEHGEHGWMANCVPAMHRAQRVIVEDVANEPSIQGTPELEIVLEDGIRAIQCTPLISRDGHVMGMLNNHFRLVHRPSESDQGYLDLLARMAADLIERAQAEKSLRESEARVTSEARSLARLNELSSRLWRTTSLREGLDEMLAGAIELLGASMGNVQLLDTERCVLTIAAQSGFSDDFLDFFREVSTEDDSACGRALRSGDRIVIEDVEADVLYAPLREVARAAGYRAVQSTPMIARDGKPLGMLSTHWRAAHRPSELDLRRLDLYVHQAAGFIERWRIDEALHEAERRYRAIFEQAGVGVAQIDSRTGRFERVNRKYCEVVGRTEAEMLTTTFMNITHPDDLAKDLAGMEHLQCGLADSFAMEKRYLRKDGSIVWVLLNVAPLRKPGEEFSHHIVVVQDITERKYAEEKLRDSEERYRATFANAAVGISHVGLDGQWLRFNDTLCSITGYSRDELLSMTFADITYPGDLDTDWVQARRVLEGEIDTYSMEKRYVRKDGSLIWVNLTVSLLRDAHRRPLHFISIIQDIDDRRQAEESLREAQACLQRWNVELEQAVNVKTAELQHSQERLRTLTSELNLAEQRERKRLATELHDHLQQMLVVGKLMIGQGKRGSSSVSAYEAVLKKVDDILSDALTYSRTLVAELSPPVLRDHGLTVSLKWLAEYMKKKHEQTVTVVVPDDHGFNLPEDQRVLLFQSVRELLINSAKYAGTGQALLTMEKRTDQLCITVKDEGIGFDLAAAAQGAPSDEISSKFGLYSIQERMRALGGTFAIQSSSGHGTMATLIMPLARVEDTGLNPPDAESEDASATVRADEADSVTKLQMMVSVLLVDDHAMVRQGLRSVLDAYADIQVIGEARDGIEAVKLVEKLRPRVVVMDINMPKMNGIEATTQIKNKWPETTIIGISVNIGDNNSDAMQRAGATTLLTKEAAVEQLHDTIVQAIGLQETQGGQMIPL